jgi:4-aminobutyrate aminotransferase
VSCAAGLASIGVIESVGLVDRARETGAFIRGVFEEARGRLAAVGETRGLGLMLGVDVLDPETGRPAGTRIKDIIRAASSAGVVMSRCGEATLRIVPPLSITREQAAEGVEALLGVLQGVGTGARV